MFTFYKSPQGLVPADEESRDWMGKLKSTEIVHGNLTRQRNSKLHGKYFSLLQYAFDCWKEDLAMREVHRIYKGAPVMPNFDRFRKDIAILCGYYEPVYTLAGSTGEAPQMRLVAKSISFAKMSDDEFEGLYSKTIDILLERIASLPQDKKEVRDVVDNLVAYA